MHRPPIVGLVEEVKGGGMRCRALVGTGDDEHARLEAPHVVVAEQVSGAYLELLTRHRSVVHKVRSDLSSADVAPAWMAVLPIRL